MTETKDLSTPEITESEKLWRDYLQKCCEVGQLDHALEQLASQTRDLEKKLEVTKREVKSVAAKHREHTQNGLKVHQVSEQANAPTPVPVETH